jgi:hypothetical protein
MIPEKNSIIYSLFHLLDHSCVLTDGTLMRGGCFVRSTKNTDPNKVSVYNSIHTIPVYLKIFRNKLLQGSILNLLGGKNLFLC